MEIDGFIRAECIGREDHLITHLFCNLCNYCFVDPSRKFDVKEIDRQVKNHLQHAHGMYKAKDWGICERCGKPADCERYGVEVDRKEVLICDPCFTDLVEAKKVWLKKGRAKE